MISADATGYATLDWLRAQSATAPVTYALRFARALNSMALEFVPLSRAVTYLDEAECVLTALIDLEGASPERVHHLVMVLANRAQCAAFCGEVGWVDLSQALDSTSAAVQLQREQLGHSERASAEAADASRAVLAEVLLLHARVLAACALLAEATGAYREAEAIIRADALEQTWGDVLRTTGAEIGVDLYEWGGPLGAGDRVRRWFWYQPA